MTRISSLSAISSLNAGDLLPIVDVLDTTMSAQGSTKKMTLSQLDARYSSSTVLAPSGDTSGVTDAANIQALVNLTAAGNPVQLTTGIFYVNQPIVLPSFTVLQGTRCFIAGGDSATDYASEIRAVAGFTSSHPASGILLVLNKQAGDARPQSDGRSNGINIRNLHLSGTGGAASVHGLCFYGATHATFIQNMSFKNITGDGINCTPNPSDPGGTNTNFDGCNFDRILFQSGIGWGLNSAHQDSTFSLMHAQGNGAGGFYMTSNNIRMIACRGDTSGLNGSTPTGKTAVPSGCGFVIDASYGNSSSGRGYGDIQLCGCSTEGNIAHGVLLTNSTAGGNTRRSPVTITDFQSTGDGKDGTGGNGWAGISVQGGQQVVWIANALCSTDHKDGQYEHPDYGLSTAALSGNAPNAVIMASGLLQGAIQPLNDAAPSQQLFIGNGVAGADPSTYGSVSLRDMATPVTELDVADSVALNTNTGFESGVGGWAAENGATLTQDATHVHSGSFAGLMVPDGVTSTPQIATNPSAPVTPGETVTFAPWYYVTGGPATMKASIHFYDIHGAHMGGSDIIASASVGTTYTQVSASGAVPAGAATASGFAVIQGTPASSVNAWVDDAVLTSSAVPLVLNVYETGDSYSRFAADLAGKLWFGSGSVAPDTDLYRSGVGTLKTDGALAVVGAFSSGAAAVSRNQSNSATTASTSLVMAGYASSGSPLWTFTPLSSGKVLAIAAGNCLTNTASVLQTVGLRYGTGTPPNAGDAVTGTQIGADQFIRSAGTAGGVGFTILGVLALTPSTAYWFDIAYDTSAGADTAIVRQPQIALVEFQ